MCLIGFAWQAHPRWRLLLVGNRDESHARPSAALARWDDLPMIAGRDLEAGGAWLGVTDAARCAVVTNVRDPRDPQLGSSRGLLIRDYLVGDADATGHASELLHGAAEYRPFNLLTFDAQAGFYLGNRPQPHAQAVTTGIHGLSNADFDVPWPKTRILMQRLQGWIDDGGDADFTALFAALADEQVAPDAQLPDTGVGLELERRLSSAFIRGADYGTRASTVVAIDHAGGGVIVERRFGPHGCFLGDTMLPFGDASLA